MELWQLDVVHGFLADGTSQALTGVDDHPRCCVSAGRWPEQTQSVTTGSVHSEPMVPAQVLTDNGRSSLGAAQPPVEVLFDRICEKRGRPPAHGAALPDHHQRLSAFQDPQSSSTPGSCSNLKTAQEALMNG
jgi:hypothetical protein